MMDQEDGFGSRNANEMKQNNSSPGKNDYNNNAIVSNREHNNYYL